MPVGVVFNTIQRMTTIQKYLARIGADERTVPDLEYLAHLQERHLLHVPFENFSVMYDDPIVLDEALLVEKIVEQKRGGFCYELNGAFGWLLRELGFKVKHISARGYNQETQQFGPEFDHMALQVFLDSWYLVDVGFGESARNPIALPVGESSDVSGRYRVRPLQENRGDKDLLRLENGEWQPQYRFKDIGYDLPAYAGIQHRVRLALQPGHHVHPSDGSWPSDTYGGCIDDHRVRGEKEDSVPEYSRAGGRFACEFRYRIDRDASMTRRRRRRRRRRRTRRTSTAVGGLTVMFIIVIGTFLFQEATDRGLIDLTPPPVEETAVSGADWYSVYFTKPDAQRTGQAERADEVLAYAILDARQSVDLAAYDIGLQSMADALITASSRGLRVRVVTDSNNLDREPVEQLLAAGVPVIDDQRSGLMHHKFVIIDSATVFTGSMNLTFNGTERNNNNLLRIDSTRLSENYTHEFEEMFLDERFGPSSAEDTPNPRLTINGILVENYFSPDDGVAAQVVSALQAAEESIYFMAFSFTREDFSQVLIEKADAGLTVRGLYESQQIASGSDQSWNLLSDAELEVLQDGNRYKLHHKVIIIDGQIVITGSYNFSNSAEDRNDENILIIHDPDLAFLYLEEFAARWLEAGGGTS